MPRSRAMLSRCKVHDLVVLPGAPCPACEAIRDGYPRGRGAPRVPLPPPSDEVHTIELVAGDVVRLCKADGVEVARGPASVFGWRVVAGELELDPAKVRGHIRRARE